MYISYINITRTKPMHIQPRTIENIAHINAAIVSFAVKVYLSDPLVCLNSFIKIYLFEVCQLLKILLLPRPNNLQVGIF